MEDTSSWRETEAEGHTVRAHVERMISGYGVWLDTRAHEWPNAAVALTPAEARQLAHQLLEMSDEARLRDLNADLARLGEALDRPEGDR